MGKIVRSKLLKTEDKHVAQPRFSTPCVRRDVTSFLRGDAPFRFEQCIREARQRATRRTTIGNERNKTEQFTGKDKTVRHAHRGRITVLTGLRRPVNGGTDNHAPSGYDFER